MLIFVCRSHQLILEWWYLFCDFWQPVSLSTGLFTAFRTETLNTVLRDNKKLSRCPCTDVSLELKRHALKLIMQPLKECFGGLVVPLNVSHQQFLNFYMKQLFWRRQTCRETCWFTARHKLLDMFSSRQDYQKWQVYESCFLLKRRCVFVAWLYCLAFKHLSKDGWQ